MELDTLFGNFVVTLIKTKGFAFFLETLVVVVLVQLFKKLLPKQKIDLGGRFDPCVIAPFVLGLLVTAGKMLLIDGVGWDGLLKNELVVEALSVGATAVTIYKLFAAADKDSLKNLMKDNAFSLVYSQLFLFSDVRERLLDKSLKMTEFVSALKDFAEDVADIYGKDAGSEAETKEKLAAALGEKLPALAVFDGGTDELNAILRAFYGLRR